MTVREEAPTAGVGASNSDDRGVKEEGRTLAVPGVGPAARALATQGVGLDLPDFYGDADGALLILLTEAIECGRITSWSPASIQAVTTALAEIPLHWVAEHLRDAGVSRKEVERYLTDVARRGERWPERTDVACARRLVAQHGRDLRYVAGRGWFVWDGRRWQADDTGEVMRRAKVVADDLEAEGDFLRSLARRVQDEDERDRFFGMAGAYSDVAIASRSAAKLKNAILLAASEPGISVRSNDLDRDAHLLTVLNGTVDLRTGALVPHRRSDLITRLAPVAHDPDATDPVWEQFLETTTGGAPELAAYLQRVAGYSLLGCNPAEVFFFFYGPGATGKSTFIEAMRSMLGDYAATADFESFIKQPSGKIRNDIARLAGVRLVASIEVDQGKELAQGLVKTITGGDTVTARFLFHEEFEFTPAFTLFLVANHPPGIDPSDDAMWRRIKVVPFDHVVPAEKRNPAVKVHLRDPSQSGAAILAWAIEGLRQYHLVGLATPDVVTAAGEDYRTHADPIGEFLDDECDLGPAYCVTSRDLHSRYQRWAMDTGNFPVLTAKALAPHLKRHGCKALKRCGPGRDRGWQGVRLRTQAPDQPTYPPLAKPLATREIGTGGAHGADVLDVSSEEAEGW